MANDFRGYNAKVELEELKHKHNEVMFDFAATAHALVAAEEENKTLTLKLRVAVDMLDTREEQLKQQQKRAKKAEYALEEANYVHEKKVYYIAPIHLTWGALQHLRVIQEWSVQARAGKLVPGHFISCQDGSLFRLEPRYMHQLTRTGWLTREVVLDTPEYCITQKLLNDWQHFQDHQERMK